MIDFFQNLHFLNPQWLWGLLGCAIIALLLRSQSKPVSAWRQLISPQLFKHQRIKTGSKTLIQPRHILVALLTLGVVAMSGPSWQRDVPEALDQQAAVVVVLDNNLSMYSTDVQPTRNQRAKQKVRDLMAARPKAQFGLVTYAGTAHSVVPVTDDPDFIAMFLDALEPALMPVHVNKKPGSNLDAALAQAMSLLNGIDRPANIVLVTDSIEEQDIDLINDFTSVSGFPVQVLAIGTAEGGPLKLPKGYRVNVPVDTQMKIDQFVALRDTGVSVVGLSVDNSDIEWLNQRIESDTKNAQNDDPQFEWQNNGYALVWLLLPLALLWFRKGWTLYSILLASTLLTSMVPQQAQADFIDWWFTSDQQAQLAYNRGDFEKAAELFSLQSKESLYWKGIAFYKANRFKDAQQTFFAIQTPEAAFYEANSYAQQKLWDQALETYDKALSLKPDFPEAMINREKIAAIMVELEEKRARRRSEQREQAMDKADEIIVDDEKASEGVEVEMTQTEAGTVEPENWLNGLQVTPAKLLSNKFVQEAAQPQLTIEGAGSDSMHDSKHD